MTAIVMNTITRAVSEYDWGFESITPTHAGSALALYQLGGDTDAGLPIQSTIRTATRMWGEALKSLMGDVYFSMEGTGQGVLKVHTRTISYGYPFPVRAAGVSRGEPGKGIRENYLGFGYENVGGEYFRIDRIEIPSFKSTTRRL